VYPGLALAKALAKVSDDVEVLYVGTATGLEAGLVPQEGIPFSSIKSRGLPRKLSFKMVITASSMGKGFFEARRILKDFKPDVVVGMGAYVSLPIVGAAALKKIPTIIHEQNAVPGMVNRLLGRAATVAATSFPGMEDEFPSAKRVVFTGNPVRDEIVTADREAAESAFEIDRKRKVLLVFGGSRGAQKINECMIEAYDIWRNNDKLQIIHATGKINYDHVRGAVERIATPEDTIKYGVYPYLDKMGEAYSVSDLLLCRSGATTLAEITTLGLPAVLIPYPYATDNHQEKNARKLEAHGAARVVLDKELDGRVLTKIVNDLIGDEEVLRFAKESSLNMGRPQAADQLAGLVFEALKEGTT
jgi:UDP-N-acetylglucosamine--N-acetylmuramyl-(pentapeptide) pyrophosphoryl-undecaprenol N-acetylglucosamine transferase